MTKLLNMKLIPILDLLSESENTIYEMIMTSLRYEILGSKAEVHNESFVYGIIYSLSIHSTLVGSLCKNFKDEPIFRLVGLDDCVELSKYDKWLRNID